MGICYIVGAGEFSPRGLHPQEGDFVIAADGGLRALEGMGIRPDLLIGEFALFGCAGGRADHLMANFQSMCRYSKLGAKVRLIAPEYDAYALSGGAMTLPHRPAGTTVSIFCHGDKAEGVSLRGLYYPLDGYTLTCDHPLGVSNQHTEETAEISVANGTLLIIQYLHREA